MQVSFKAHLLNTPTIYKKNNGKFDLAQTAKFWELDINSDEDYEAIREVGFSWENGASLAGDMLDMFATQKFSTAKYFSPSYRFFALTNRDDGKLVSDSILGVASIREDDENTYILQHLQVEPKNIYKSRNREYKHIGKAILMSIIKMLPGKNIKLYSFSKDAERFYKKFDFVKILNSSNMIYKAKL